MMKSVTCLVYLHRLHETVASYIANAEDKNIATEIGNCYNFHGQLSNIICFSYVVRRAGKWGNQSENFFCTKIVMPFSSPLFCSTKLNNSKYERTRRISLPPINVAAPPLLFPLLKEVGSLNCVKFCTTVYTSNLALFKEHYQGG